MAERIIIGGFQVLRATGGDPKATEQSQKGSGARSHGFLLFSCGISKSRRYIRIKIYKFKHNRKCQQHLSYSVYSNLALATRFLATLRCFHFFCISTSNFMKIAYNRVQAVQYIVWLINSCHTMQSEPQHSKMYPYARK